MKYNRLFFFAMMLTLLVPETDAWHPLGQHAEPEGTITEIEDQLPPARFFDEFVLPSRPGVLRAVIKGQQACQEWTDDYLMHHYGHEIVTVEQGKKENRLSLNVWTEPFSDFLRKYTGQDPDDVHKGDIYSVSTLVLPMRPELTLPGCVDCSAFIHNDLGGMAQTNHWFSSGGTSSALAKDAYETLFCFLDGSSDFVLIDKGYTKSALHWDVRDGHDYASSAVDTDAVNFTAFPNFKDIKFWTAHAEQGDCIYIPVGWYYHMRASKQRNLAVNFWWSMDTSEDGRLATAACKDPSSPTKISAVVFSEDEHPTADGPVIYSTDNITINHTMNDITAKMSKEEKQAYMESIDDLAKIAGLEEELAKRGEALESEGSDASLAPQDDALASQTRRRQVQAASDEL